MDTQDSRQMELSFGLPSLSRYRGRPPFLEHSKHYREKRSELLDQYPRDLAALLDAYFEDEYLDAKRNTPQARVSAIQIGHLALGQLRRAIDCLRESKVDVAYSSSKLRDLARECSESCEQLRVLSACKETALSKCSSLALNMGVEPPRPKGPTRTVDGCLQRLISLTWWQRALRRSYMRQSEAAFRDAGLVSRKTGLYASNDAVNRRISSKSRQREFLQFIEAVNDLGERFTLDELVDASVSNPRVRRSEMMARVAGLESECRSEGMVADLYTLTTPSRYHCTLATGARNTKYDGSTPRDGQLWLRRNWSRIRAKFKRDHLVVRGLRVAEPHHDGTPHWHLLLYCAPDHRKRVQKAIREHMLRDAGDELGASTRRIVIKAIDYSKGTGASYVAKYVSKNIDGFGVDKDHEGSAGLKAADAAVRVESWASLWGIRQFQFIGAAPVGVWREIRRLRERTDEWLEPIRQLVDKGDWAGFSRVIAGSASAARALIVSLWRKWFDRPGEYGDPIGFKSVGVRNDTERILTRERTWTFRPVVPLEFCQ